ncbi:hypothetical protein Scep_006175 [Stephania cephalantha]|uniref:non-specific serine/threonine protein kinase n=1 Tax=Stephania cephalantha TaxID=152367 RepID=A0AAP0K7H9_9MAGN
MSIGKIGSTLSNDLAKKTSIFGLPGWVVAGVIVGGLIVLLLVFIFFCINCLCRKKTPKLGPNPAKFAVGNPSPEPSKEIQEDAYVAAAAAVPEIHVDIGKAEHRVVFSDRHSSQSGESRSTTGTDSASMVGGRGPPEVSHLGWGHWYTLRELEAATEGLADENVIGEGGYGIVYRGVLQDNTVVAVKNLLNNRGQAEKEFRVEVEAIGRVRHKNLVRLLGYCMEGAYRMLVYEYIDNGNLEQWLHGDVGLRILLCSLAYLHEGLEPKVVHRDVKSSNILLDRQWNAKVSDFGLAKLLFSERSYVTTRVMGTYGYVAPEYACSGMLNEKSDIYSFGILIMEIISGRNPVDHSRPPGEVNLVDWLKGLVGERKSEQVVDPKLPEMPPSKELKRILLVALKCVDPDATKRPKMGHVIHMLEADASPFQAERRAVREASRLQRDCAQERQGVTRLGEKNLAEDPHNTDREESSSSRYQQSKNQFVLQQENHVVARWHDEESKIGQETAY